VLVAPTLAGAEVGRDQLELVLSTRESLPTKTMLLALGTEAELERALHQIVREPSRRRLARNRALTILRQFPSRATAKLLALVIAASRSATKGLATIDLAEALLSYGAVARFSAEPVVVSLLGHPNLDVRIVAAQALILSGAPAAQAKLKFRLDAETNALVRRELQRLHQQLMEPGCSAGRRARPLSR
jgi:hypothetical protein